MEQLLCSRYGPRRITSFNLYHFSQGSMINVPTLQMKELRSREVRGLSHGHIVKEWGSWHMSPSPPIIQLNCLPSVQLPLPEKDDARRSPKANLFQYLHFDYRKQWKYPAQVLTASQWLRLWPSSPEPPLFPPQIAHFSKQRQRSPSSDPTSALSIPLVSLHHFKTLPIVAAWRRFSLCAE